MVEFVIPVIFTISEVTPLLLVIYIISLILNIEESGTLKELERIVAKAF